MYIIFLGSSCVGKTTIIRQIMGIPTNKSLRMTLGIEMNSHKQYGTLIDTGDYDTSKSMIDYVMTPLTIIIAVYDIHSKSSFEKAKEILNEYMGKNLVFLVGNKIDLKGQEYLDENTYRISGKTGQNIESCFDDILQQVQMRSKRENKDDHHNSTCYYSCF